MGMWRGVRAAGQLFALAVLAGVAGLAQPAAAQTVVQVGSSLNGALSREDQTLESGRYVDTYELRGRAGQQIQISVTTSSFDAATAIGDGSNFFEIDDGSRPGTNASLVVTLPNTGRYFVTVSSVELWRTGSYVFQVSDVSAAPAAPSMGGGVGRRPPPPVAPPPSQNATAGVLPTVSLGATISGSLGRDDDVLEGGSYVDGYRFQGRAGQRVRVTVEPNGFNAVLAIADPDGDFFEIYDMTETGSGYADLTVTLPRNASYIIVVNARYAGQGGGYTLWVSDGR